jgi:GNAT superfamily N-acetyltransferase
VPFTEAEIRQMGQELRFIIGARHVAIAEWKGEPAAMTVVMPDINRMIADFNGRLLPFNWLKLLWRLKFAGTPARMRMPLMGVRRKYQNTVVGAALALAVIEEVNAYHIGSGVQSAELSWILETNTGVRKVIESIGAKPYKTYRIYERDIA